MNPDGAVPHLMTRPRFPLTRVIALLGPYTALLSGALAAWLAQHFPGLVDDVGKTTEGITQAATFIIGALLTWALQHKYLDGWQNWEQAVLAVEAAARGAKGHGQPGAVAIAGASEGGGDGSALAPALAAGFATANGNGNGDGRGGGGWPPEGDDADPFGGFDPAVFDTEPGDGGRG